MATSAWISRPRCTVSRAGPSPPRRRYPQAEGRVAQRESARFTRGRSLVRSQSRPLPRERIRAMADDFAGSGLSPTRQSRRKGAPMSVNASPEPTPAVACSPGHVSAVRCGTKFRMSSSTRRTTTARAAAPGPGRRSTRRRHRAGEARAHGRSGFPARLRGRRPQPHALRCVRLAALLGCAGRRLRARCNGIARRCAVHPAERAHLRRLEGTLVRDHRRPASERGVRLARPRSRRTTRSSGS